ncbi:MAG: hypothetical protein D6711_14480 [Chloroflexi bacterium]|nr:MAG: hypothetical protein D6711_14480 [Chloroflexota bacterium]
MDWFSNNLDNIANIIQIVTFVTSIFIWIQTTKINRAVRLESSRQNKQVSIRLTNGNEYYELPVKLRGSEVSRAEILGRIGMIPINPDKKLGDRGFLITYTSGEAFMRRINEILDATQDTILEIPCKNEEYNQFNFPS